MKKLTLAFVAMLMTSLALADGDNYLYWMVELSASESKYAFCYATVSLDDTPLDNKTTGGIYIGTEVDNSGAGTSGTSTESVYAYNFSSGSKFLFELFAEDGDLIASKSVSYAALNKYIGSSMSKVASPYVVSGFTEDVPEPTSGLLMLLGLAGLALKRKRT